MSDENHPGDVEDGGLPTPAPVATFGDQLRPAILGILLLTVVTGVVFPLVLAGFARTLFYGQADGSLVKRDDVVIGSEFIGQNFTRPGYFHPRPSAAGRGYDAASSGGTNLSPTNPKLWDGDGSFAGIRQLASEYRRINGLLPDAGVPVDAVTRSGSGLDPHISPANAALQVTRVARTRGLSEDAVRRLVADYTQGRQYGFLGEPRVEVLALNCALDRGTPPISPVAHLPSPENAAARWLEYAIFIALVASLAWPVGRFLARVFERQPTGLDPLFVPVENMLYRLFQVHPESEMSPIVYALSFVTFGALGTVLLFLLLVVQSWLPGGPEARYLTTPMTLHLAANTAVSFSTTTTWQAYSGETTLRYLIQVLGLTSQNFLGGAAGLAVGFAFIRGFARANSPTVGNFWVDLIRALLLLLPLSFVIGLVLVWQGVPLNLSPYTEVRTLEGLPQTIAQGPVAVLEVIKNLGTNGCGFFNANSAHPYANPTPLTNFLGLLAIAVLPASLPIAFGHMVKRPRAGWVLLAVMVVLLTVGLVVCDISESVSRPSLAGVNVTGGNMEGKEVRFGIHGSVLAAVVTSNGATGSYNSMHGSYQPIGVLVLLTNMLLGELVFGGLGTGFYSIVLTALIGVFVGGLMIGRTPDYLGKTVMTGEAKLIAFYALLTPMVVLSLTALAVTTEAGRAALVTNHGPRGFTEILFAYTSCLANNGQNLAGLDANNAFYNITTVPAMLVGRFGHAVLALVLAGRFASQGRHPVTPGTLPCDTVTFGILVLGTIILLGVLSFLPPLALGPILEQLRP